MSCSSNADQHEEEIEQNGLTVINNQFEKVGTEVVKVKNSNLNILGALSSSGSNSFNNNNNNHHHSHQNGKKPDARDRWKLLAFALRRSSVDSDNGDAFDGISQRQFDGLNIVRQRCLPNLPDSEQFGSNAYAYEIKLSKSLDTNLSLNFFEVIVHHVNRQWTAKDLIGFNNTGNICVWPSEEALAYYALENITIFKDTWLLELGGGMTCLAGLMIAKYGSPYLVHLTDGNTVSVANVKRTLRLNDFDCFVKCSQLKWENIAKRHPAERCKYNMIICADCLFFVDSHTALLDTIDFYLAQNGKAFIMAPKRNNTFDDFVHKAVNRGFHVNVIKNYSYDIWLKHLQLKNSQNYNEDIHYPLLLTLEKRDTINLV